jgi:hypothetical protein
MTKDEFDAETDDLIERIGFVIDARHYGAVQVALAELLFNDIDTREDFDDLISMLNDLAEDVSNELNKTKSPSLH